MKITNKAKTVEANANHSITVERQHGENHLLIEGEIPLQAKQTKVWRSVEDPTIYTLDIFKQSLEEHGIQIIGKSKIQRGKAPKKDNPSYIQTINTIKGNHDSFHEAE